MKSFLVIGMGRFGTAVAQELTGAWSGGSCHRRERRERSASRMMLRRSVQGDAQDEAVLGPSACATSTAVSLR